MKVNNKILGDFADETAERLREATSTVTIQSILDDAEHAAQQFGKATFKWYGTDSNFYDVLESDLPTMAEDLFLRGFPKEAERTRKLVSALHKPISDAN